MAEKSSLFVYGSFSEGMVHYQKIQEYITKTMPATIQGSVFRLQVGYPVYVQQGTTQIPGQIVEMEAPEILFKILDEFHGFSPINPEKCLYWKTDVKATIGDGSLVDAITYALNPVKLPKSARLIENGDWKQDLNQRPALTDQLTERQVRYVVKLGKSTGRDIVPIDLDLYRELMKLDLIVDKGRRLALTSFGKEVFRYLN